jgi:hypothetical protein
MRQEKRSTNNNAESYATLWADFGRKMQPENSPLSFSDL